MQYGFSLLSNMRTYSIELRQRNYPTFEGRYNAYISCYGQLSGQYLGNIEHPIKLDVIESDVPELLINAGQFILDNRNVPVSIW